MNVERHNIESLPEDHWAIWKTFQAGNPALYSPFFHADYIRVASRFNEGCRVAVIKSEGAIIGFLPFRQKHKNGPANPIGMPLTDYHGIISARPLSVDMKAVLSEAHIGAFYMPNHKNVLVTEKTRTKACSVMSLRGYENAEGWRAENTASYRRFYKTLQRKLRKTEREIGRVEFIWQSQDRAHFDLVLKWKRRQLIDSAKYDVFGVDWTVDFLFELLSQGPKAALRADMHVMLIAGQPAAIELGLTDGKTYHNWIISYDDAYAKSSPGALLKEAMIDQAFALGYHRFDLGAGTDRHKSYYATEDVQTAETMWFGTGVNAAAASLYSKLEEVGETKLKDVPGKVRRRYSQIAACDPRMSGQFIAMMQAIKTSAKRAAT